MRRSSIPFIKSEVVYANFFTLHSLHRTLPKQALIFQVFFVKTGEISQSLDFSYIFVYNVMCAQCLWAHIFYFIKKEENHANF